MSLISRIKTWVTGETLTAAQLNAEFDNVLDNLDPTHVDDESASDAAAQATSDPYAASSLVKATSLEVELQQLRYLIAQITGETYWYIDPDNTIAAMEVDINALQAATALTAPSGTIMLFGQNSAPTGWTKKTDWQDNAMLCYATGNIGSGGSVNPQGTHTHTGPNHTHGVGTYAGASHTHTGPSHTHTGPSHTHTLGTGAAIQYYSGTPIAVYGGALYSGAAGSGAVRALSTMAVGGTGATGTGGTGATGADGDGAVTGASAAGGTGATGANTAPHYQEVIAATKD